MDKTFSQRVIDATLSIPSGRVATYGDISRVCGGSGQAARSVLGILPRAARSGIDGIPWHRIVYSGGRVWSSGGYTSQRMRLYKKEGIEVNEKGYIQNFITILYGF